MIPKSGIRFSEKIMRNQSVRRAAPLFMMYQGQDSLSPWPSLRVAAKIATGFVERLDRIADTLFAFLLPGPRFWPQRDLRG